MTEKKIAKKPAKKKSAAIFRITLIRSPIGTTYRHKATLAALGLRHVNQSVEQADTPQLKGMLSKVGHLVKVEACPREAGAGTGKEK